MVVSGAWRAVQYSGNFTLQQAWQEDGSGDRTRPEYEPGVIGSFALATHSRRNSGSLAGTGSWASSLA